MSEVGILADDLSGALDAAAPFATAAGPVAVGWVVAPRRELRFAIDSETRHASAEAAAGTVAALLPQLRDCRIAFKKIDSQLRGSTMAELAVCCDSPDFASIVVAPAFPEQQRVTRGGRQFGQDPTGQWLPGVADLGALTRGGVAARLVARDAEPGSAGVQIFDAESPADLDTVVRAGRRLAQPVLWCGSAGLARALGAGGGRIVPAGRRRLVIVGSDHPVSRRQVACLAAAGASVVQATGDAAATAAEAGVALDRDGRAAIAFTLPPLSPEGAEAAYRAVFARLAGLAAPDLLIVSGGDTVFRLCQETGVAHLDALGEYLPGIAVSRLDGGAWSGATIISKSGAFGADDFFARLWSQHEGSAA